MFTLLKYISAASLLLTGFPFLLHRRKHASSNYTNSLYQLMPDDVTEICDNINDWDVSPVDEGLLVFDELHGTVLLSKESLYRIEDSFWPFDDINYVNPFTGNSADKTSSDNDAKKSSSPWKYMNPFGDKDTPIENSVPPTAVVKPVPRAVVKPRRELVPIASKLPNISSDIGSLRLDNIKLLPKQVNEGLMILQNRKRGAVGLEPLQWSNDLAAFAKKYLSTGPSCSAHLQHSPSSMRFKVADFRLVGENLWKGYWVPTIQDVVDDWYNEVHCYTYGPVGKKCIGNCGTSCSAKSVRAGCQQGHFTQMMWASLTHIGCSSRFCNGAWILGCNYGDLNGIGGNFYGFAPFSAATAQKLGLSSKPCAPLRSS